MGRKFDYSKKWDKHETEGRRRRPRRLPRKITSKLYLGYGYYIVLWNTGERELRWDPTLVALPLGSAEKYDDQGFPIWE